LLGIKERSGKPLREETVLPEESAAIEWLISKGYKREDIHFQSKKSPDIITPDLAYEVKKIHVGNAISFSGMQLRTLNHCGTFHVLVYENLKMVAEIPDAIIHSRAPAWGLSEAVHFNIYYEDSSIIVNTRLQPALYRELQTMSRECDKSVSDLVRDAIQAMIGMYLNARKK
jgi:hypothetical protein